MPIFNYIALNTDNERIKGKIESNSLKEVREFLRKINLIPMKIEEQTPLIRIKSKKENKKKFKNVKNIKINTLSLKEKTDFTNALYFLIKTGISLGEGLLFLENNASTLKTQVLAIELRKHIFAGANLSESISKYPKIFDPIYVGLIKAGEESGELDNTLERILYLLNKQNNLKNKVLAAITYPCMVVFLALAVCTIMLTFVFPSFKDMYDQMGQKLPLITIIFMNVGTFLRDHLYLIPLLFGSLAYIIYTLLKWPLARKIIDGFFLNIPVISKFIKFASLSNFVSVLKVSFEAGVPVIEGLLLASQTVNHYILRAVLRESVLKIQQGQSLSAALKASDIIPDILMSMIATGEQSGRLSEALGYAGEFIDTEIERVIETLSKLFEPVLIVVIGGIILVMALALYLPLFQSYSNLM